MEWSADVSIQPVATSTNFKIPNASRAHLKENRVIFMTIYLFNFSFFNFCFLPTSFFFYTGLILFIIAGHLDGYNNFYK